VRLDRDVVTVAGPEAAQYLQGQLSQDVLTLADGDFAWSWLLAPNGKVDALVRVTRLAPEDWLLDTDSGWGETLVARLNRFKLRTKAEIAASPLRVVRFRSAPWRVPGDAVAALSPPWPGLDGADVLCPPEAADKVAAVGAADYEAERIIAGIPRMGLELSDRTIPGETGIVPFTVSFTKGCYTGQELVARVDSRGGNVPRRLRGLRFEEAGEEGVAPGTELLGPDGQTAGTITSVASSAEHGWVGLGYVRRGVDPADHLAVSSGRAVVTQVELNY
jgi:folate-binding protein YgfZ